MRLNKKYEGVNGCEFFYWLLFLQIVNIKKTLKTQAVAQVLESDEAMTTDCREALPGTEKGKKPAKAKSSVGRSGGKFWQKS